MVRLIETVLVAIPDAKVQFRCRASGNALRQEVDTMLKGIASGIFWAGAIVGAVVASLIALMI